jgi:hypothetical protein
VPNVVGGPGERLTTGHQVNVNAQGLNIVGDAANEPSMAVDIRNRNRIAIGWRQFDSVASNFRQAGNGYSTDGGRTWHKNAALQPGVFRSDPVLASNADGVFFYNSLTTVTGGYTCDVFKSLDGGKTWPTSAPAAGGDKQWMTCDQTNSIGSGHLYANWSFYASCCGQTSFVRSTNGGASFNPPQTMLEAPYWGTLTTGPDGTLYTFGDSGFNSYYVVVKSTNAKNAAVTPAFSLAGTLQYATFGTISQGTDPNPGGLLGQGWIDADRSGGPRNGWLYVVWSLDPPGPDPLDVMFSRSTDGGTTWSLPKRLNDDAGVTAFQWFGTMSVAPNGRLDVIWNDTRNHLTNVRLSEVYYASSNDGGTTWTANQQLTPTWDSEIGWPNQNKIGDYYHMVSDKVGAFLAYAATFNGEQDVYCLRIGDYDCNGNGVADSVDIATGASLDTDSDGIPNECEERCPADYNGDGFVDGIDYDNFNNDFEAGNAAADINGDGFVDGIDYDQFNNAFERGC